MSVTVAPCHKHAFASCKATLWKSSCTAVAVVAQLQERGLCKYALCNINILLLTITMNCIGKNGTLKYRQTERLAAVTPERIVIQRYLTYQTSALFNRRSPTC